MASPKKKALLKGFRTYAAAAGVGLLGVMQSADVQNFITALIAAHPGPVLTGVGVLFGILRKVTDTKAGKAQ